MATTQTLRDQYRQPFFRGARSDGRPLCDYSQARTVVLYAGGSAYPSGRVTLKVHPLALEAFAALAAVFLHHRYAFEETAGGTVSCRNITGASTYRINLQISCQCPKATSLHLHGIALDINPSRNRYRVTSGGGVIQWGRQTDLPKALIADIEAIRTKTGKKVFEWGGRWWNIKDPMHFEVDLLRSELEAGIDRTTVRGYEAYVAWLGGSPIDEEENVLTKGDKGNAVTKLQNALLAWNPDALPQWGADGDFGSETEAWVANYQTAADLDASGRADGVTMALLLEYLPDTGVPAGNGYTKAEADARFAPLVHPHKATTTIT